MPIPCDVTGGGGTYTPCLILLQWCKNVIGVENMHIIYLRLHCLYILQGGGGVDAYQPLSLKGYSDHSYHHTKNITKLTS